MNLPRKSSVEIATGVSVNPGRVPILRTAFRRAMMALILLSIAGFVACSPQKQGIRVVLITIDTVRYDSLAGAQDMEPSMPRLRDWGRKAANFSQFWASTSSTQPSHASMFTGLHPWEHGVTGNAMLLGNHHVTVVEQLREAGFATSAVVASVPVSRQFGFGQGFDRYHDEFDHGKLRGEFRREAELGGEEPNPNVSPSFYSLADSITEKALVEIEVATAERQFFWFHFFDPHAPYGDVADGPTLRPGEILKRAVAGLDTSVEVKEARELYNLDVAFLDEGLGRVLERLEQDSTEVETHIVVVADHGESFGEEGSLSHGRRLTPSMIHVPCLIRSNRCRSGIRADIASSVDIAPTLLAMAGIEGGRDHGVPCGGRDLTRSAAIPATASGMRRTYRDAFHEKRLDGSVHVLPEYLFYFLTRDGDLFRGNSSTIVRPDGSTMSEDQTEALKKRFAGFERSIQRSQAQDVEDAGTKEALQALGYVQ